MTMPMFAQRAGINQPKQSQDIVSQEWLVKNKSFYAASNVAGQTSLLTLATDYVSHFESIENEITFTNEDKILIKILH